MKVVIFSSLAWSLINFRGRLIEDLVAAGHDVTVCAPDFDRAVIDQLAARRARFCHTPMRRAGMNPFADLVTLASYLLLLMRLRPDAVIAYTQKPIIYGGLACRMTRVPRFFVLMSGLGYVFSDEARSRVRLRRIVSLLYRAGVRRARTIFVFNGDDRRAMMAHGIIGSDHHVVQVPGSGVDIGHFTAAPLPEGPPCFVMIARLMRDKGVADYIEAARMVKDHFPAARFRLVGRPEADNPTGYPVAELESWVRSGLIEHIPETRDVRPYLAAAHVFVLPSYYREGLPRTLLEALATGRPVITTDMPGCSEPVTPGENGWLVPPRNPSALAVAMLNTIRDRAALEAMATAARQTAVSRYDVAIVNSLLLSVMHLDGRSAGTAGRAAMATDAPSNFA